MNAGAPARGWTIAFRVFLALLISSTLNGLRRGIFGRDELAPLFPGAGDALFTLLIAVAALGIVAAVGLWLFRRWALWLFGGTSIAMIALDLAARGPALHLAAAVISSALVFALAFPVRARFSGVAGR